MGTSFGERVSAGLSSIGGFFGDVAAGIGGGLLDIGQEVFTGLQQQLPGAILGGLLPQPAAPSRGIAFTPGAAPTTRTPEPFVAPRIDPSQLVAGGTFNLALPGGAPTEAGVAGSLLGGALEDFGEIIGGAVRGFREGAGEMPGGFAMANGTVQLFRPTAGTGIRPARVVVVPHPVTGAPVFFGNLGRPLLWSRDLSAARKVDRLARRARRVKRGR